MSADLFQRALAEHRAGRFQQAEAAYRRILAVEPAHAEALHLLGVLAHQVARNDVAVDYIRRAIGLNRVQPEYYVNLGNALRALGRVAEAETSYREALRLWPDFPEAHNNLGAALCDLGHLSEAEASYREALHLRPDYPGAHNNLGNVLRALGRPAEAETSYRKALRLQPEYPEAHRALGTVLSNLGRLAEAEISFRKALNLRPDFAETHNNLGNVLRALGRPAEAETSYREALRLQPEYPEAHNNLGHTLYDLGRPAEAETRYRAALRLRPDFPEACNNLGRALFALGRLAEAETSYQQALRLRPDYPEAHNNLANALCGLGRFAEAEESYQQALRLRPVYPEAHSNLGNALCALGRPAEAEASCRTALRLRPDFAEAHNNLGVALCDLGRLAEAEISYQQALRLRPVYPEAYCNLGGVLRDLGDPVEAEASCRQALHLQPDFAEAHNNLGVALCDLGRMAEAQTSYQKALRVRPDYAEAHLHLSLALLTAGRLEEGWAEYEWRSKASKGKLQPRGFQQPQWRGEDISGKTLLLHAEQGFGDTLQFCRYAPMAAAKARVILEVPQPLLRLCDSLHGIDRVTALGEALPRFDVHCPLMSLPLAFGTTLESIPTKVPYLSADAAQVAAWRRRVESLPGLRVGLVWAGGPRPWDRTANVVDRRRSTRLEQFAPLARVAGISFVSLQKGEAAAQSAAPPPGMVIHDWTDELIDFADTAALIEALDLVISVDTSVVHLAGALGKPVWILNRFDSCWRWLLDREDSPWYPTARLFRQQRSGDWDEVFSRIAEELAATAGSGMGPMSALTNERFNRAVGFHRNGDLLPAEKIYREVLAEVAGHFGALHSLGLLLIQTGRLEGGVELIDRALAVRPDYVEALSNRAYALKALNRLDAALASCDRALAINPEFADALKNRGAVLMQLGRFEEALASFDRALAITPDQAVTLNDRGVVLAKLSRLEEALASFDAALAIRPDYAEALSNRGRVLTEWKQFEDAETSYRQALRLLPDVPDAHNNLGAVLWDLGRLAEAETSYREALRLRPDFPAAHSNLGTALRALGRPAEAEASCREALRLQPDFVEAHNNLGVALYDLGRLAEAEMSCREAIRLRPDFSDAYNNLGAALRERGETEEAKASFERALALDPTRADTLANLGSILREHGWLDQAIAAEKASLQLQPGLPLAEAELIYAQTLGCDWIGIETWMSRLLAAAKTPHMVSPFVVLPQGASPADHLFCAEQWIRGRMGQACLPIRFSKKRQIRLGYLSVDFRNDVVGFLLPELIERHDRREFEVLAYCYGREDGGEPRRRLQAGFDKFNNIAPLGVEGAARQIHADGVDILIDLTGYTQRARSGILALRPAPVQVNYLGYPGTMGAEFMDYIIVDPWLVPFTEQQFYTERLVQLPECYQPSDTHRRLGRVPSRAECGLPADGFVFCCFNNSYKIRPPFFDIWMRLLHQVPNSVLWLIKGHSLAEENLTRAAAARGVAPERLRFSERVPNPEYLARLSMADLFLDTLPYNAGATANDALWAGLPVLTCTGANYTGRMAGSLLRAAGLPELVAASPAEYEALAFRLATEPTLLAILRCRLSANRHVEPLFDMARYTRHLERAYLRMWNIRQSGNSPTPFAVEPLPRKGVPDRD